MKFQIEFDKDALEDLRKATSFYNEFRHSLGVDFLHHFYDCIKILETHPAFQIRYKQIRCLNLKRFPFMVHYFLDTESKIVHILAIINTSQDPETTYL